MERTAFLRPCGRGTSADGPKRSRPEVAGLRGVTVDFLGVMQPPWLPRFRAEARGHLRPPSTTLKAGSPLRGWAVSEGTCPILTFFRYGTRRQPFRTLTYHPAGGSKLPVQSVLRRPDNRYEGAAERPEGARGPADQLIIGPAARFPWMPDLVEGCLPAPSSRPGDTAQPRPREFQQHGFRMAARLLRR